MKIMKDRQKLKLATTFFIIVMLVMSVCVHVKGNRKIKRLENKNERQMRQIDSLQNVLVGADWLLKTRQTK